MASNTWKWVLGCGIGCLVVAAIVVALGVGGFFVVKDTFKDVAQGIEKAEQAKRLLEERYGRIHDFRPRPDGRIPPERIEAFLRVRELMAPALDGLDGTLRVLSDRTPDGEDSRGGTMGKVRAGMGLIPQLLGYFGARNQALLDGEMGLGEYHYMYAVVFYAWLGKSPADGPPFRLSGDEQRHDWSGDFGAEDESAVLEERLERTSRGLNRKLLPVLRNQLVVLDQDGAAPNGGLWRGILAAEIASMESDPERLPWADGVPEVIAISLEPFRASLEASYREMCNAVEMGVEGH
jgi:hypothetical protein